jgi:DNA-binding response OmpR family regulator
VVLDPARMGVSGPELHRRINEAALGPAIVFTARWASRPAETRPASDGTGRIRVDTAGRRIFIDESELRLSPKERDLLAYMLRRPGVALTRTQILHDVWGRDGTEMAKTVDVHVRWLRQRLAAHEPIGVQIITVRGTGYRLDLT